MRIAIETRAMSHPQPGGFKSYTTNLVRALVTDDDTNDYLLYVDRPLTDGAVPQPSNAVQQIVRSVPGWPSVPFREQVLLPAFLMRDRPDLVHLPCGTGPVFSRGRVIATIHDAIEFLETPRMTRPPSREEFRRLLMSRYNKTALRFIAQQARAVITDSAHSKADICRVLRVPESRVRVIPIAHSECYKPIGLRDREHALRKRDALPPSFILALGSATPRKNLSGLLRTYARLSPWLREQYPLVLVLAHSLLLTQTQDEVASLGLSKSVRFLIGLQEDELVSLYNLASVFVFPSLYEGFGLPVLEAMACGTPVVASDLTSVPEVTGDAAELADPRDEEKFAQALIRVLSSPERQAALSEAGLRRARQFSWHRTAEMTLDVYREVAAA